MTQAIATNRIHAGICVRCAARTESRVHRLCTMCRRNWKYCPGCWQSLPLERFPLNVTMPDDLNGHCRQCISEKYGKRRLNDSAPLTTAELQILYDALPSGRRYSFILSLSEEASERLLQYQCDIKARADKGYQP